MLFPNAVVLESSSSAGRIGVVVHNLADGTDYILYLTQEQLLSPQAGEVIAQQLRSRRIPVLDIPAGDTAIRYVMNGGEIILTAAFWIYLGLEMGEETRDHMNLGDSLSYPPSFDVFPADDQGNVITGLPEAMEEMGLGSAVTQVFELGTADEVWQLLAYRSQNLWQDNIPYGQVVPRFRNVDVVHIPAVTPNYDSICPYVFYSSSPTASEIPQEGAEINLALIVPLGAVRAFEPIADARLQYHQGRWQLANNSNHFEFRYQLLVRNRINHRFEPHWRRLCIDVDEQGSVKITDQPAFNWVRADN